MTDNGSLYTSVVLAIAVIGSILTTAIIRLKNIKSCRCCSCMSCEQLAGPQQSDMQVITPDQILNNAILNNSNPQALTTPKSNSKPKMMYVIQNLSQNQSQNNSQNPDQQLSQQEPAASDLPV